MDALSRIAEDRIARAIENGELASIEGMGSPLMLDDDPWVPQDLKLAYRMLKNAGFTPPELELRGEIMNLRSLIETIDDDKERMKRLRQLNAKLLRLNLFRKRPLDIPDEYEDLLGERFVG